jgi:hypothetical protein
VLLWGLPGTWGGQRPKAALSPAELNAAWRDLGSASAADAYRAVCRLASAPKAAVPFLRRNVPPAPHQDEKALQRLIGRLDADDFEDREEATRALERIGGAARPALLKALAARPSQEKKRRLEALLARLPRARAEAALRRPLRAVEALELMGTPEASQALAALAKGGRPLGPHPGGPGGAGSPGPAGETVSRAAERRAARAGPLALIGAERQDAWNSERGPFHGGPGAAPVADLGESSCKQPCGWRSRSCPATV